MKKVLIGLLLTSLSALYANNQSTVNTANEEKYRMNHDITYVEGFYEIDLKYENMYSKEKKDFKDRYITYNEKKDYKNLIPLLKEYIKKYPDDSFAYETLGTIYSAQENLVESEKNYLKSIELGNDDTGKYSLALLYLNKKGKEEIGKKYIEEIEKEGYKSHYSLKELRDNKNFAFIGNAYAIFRLAAFYNNYGNHRLAEKYATEFLEFDEENSDILQILSEAYFVQKKYAQVENTLLPIAQKGNPEAQYYLAISYYYLENFSEAERWAKKVLEIAKKNPSSYRIESVNELLNGIDLKLKNKK